LNKQDKTKEIEFFDRYAGAAEYNVFSEDSNERLIEACLQLAGLKSPGRVVDLGCGSGTFSALLAKKGFDVTGLDISREMVAIGRKRYGQGGFVPRFTVGDVEHLPFAGEILDGVLLSGLLHHLPDPYRCIQEVYRVLKPGGVFMAFDPNRANPFMYLYRDRSSPFYSSVGVTANERPVLAKKLAAQFRSAGFTVQTDFLSNVRYRYVASKWMRLLLSAYNAVDGWFFRPLLMRPMRAFVITAGRKPV
jgi:ubiquinone/menaquinone biosynthesis C-methylase UbiE